MEWITKDSARFRRNELRDIQIQVTENHPIYIVWTVALIIKLYQHEREWARWCRLAHPDTIVEIYRSAPDWSANWHLAIGIRSDDYNWMPNNLAAETVDELTEGKCSAQEFLPRLSGNDQRWVYNWLVAVMTATILTNVCLQAWISWKSYEIVSLRFIAGIRSLQKLELQQDTCRLGSVVKSTGMAVGWG